MEEDFVIQVRAIADEEPAMKKLQQADWPMLQHHDPVLRHVLDWMALPSPGWISLGDHLKGKIPAGAEKPFQLRQKDFVLKQQMLYLKVTPPNTQEEAYAFVVPNIKRRVALDGCHRFMGHQGRDRTSSLLKERFWWPGMVKECTLALKDCRRCIIFEAKVQTPKLAPILTTELMDLIHIDFIKMEIPADLRKKPKTKNVLVVVDHFTRFVQAYVTKDQTARTVAKILYDRYFSVFGFPR